MKRPAVHGLAAFLAATAVIAGTAAAQGRSAGASDVFRRFAPYVTQIQVVGGGSGAKSTIGSGFFVSEFGHVVTNYHVIASLINRPDRYRAELVAADGSTIAATVIAIDVVQDLAILKTDARGRPHFPLGPTSMSNGERLFSLGNPKDLGLSIVEGTYNGLLQHTLYPRIHLTASLNPGMSGGPTVDEDGRVIGVNVSTEGNDVSFLVPAERAAALLRTALDTGPRQLPSLEVVARQLRAHQDTHLPEMFGTATKRIDFGPFRVVTQPAPFFRCWADASDDDDDPYETVRHRCATEDDIYLDDDQTTGFLTVTHLLITTKGLNAPRFYAQYTKNFASDNSPAGEEEYVTNWKCVTRNIRNDSARMRAVLCIRRYRKLGELYDANLKLAMLGRSNVGLVSTLNVAGVTYENLTTLSERFIRQVTWR